MQWLRFIVALIFGIAGTWFYFELPQPYNYLAGGSGLFIALICICYNPEPSILRYGTLSWTKSQLCRHVLFTGDTGCGKTSCGIQPLVIKITKNVPNWGGLILGAKGDEHEFAVALAEANHQPERAVVLEVKPNGVSSDWKPKHRYNLVSDRSLPWTSHAKAIVDTASALTAGQQHSHFKPAAQMAIANALELLSELNLPVTLNRVHSLLMDRTVMEHHLTQLTEDFEPSPRRELLIKYFDKEFIKSKSDDLRESLAATVQVYLGFFLNPDIAEVFCSDEPNTVEIEDVDQGRWICVSMPQRFSTERRYINTYLKTLFFYHALRRFELPKNEQKKKNLLLFVADEYQDLVTAAEDGMADHRVADRIRSAGLAIIAGMQSEISADPVIGREKRKVLALNLRTRFIFRGADIEGAEASADFLLKKKVTKKTRSVGGLGAATLTYREEEEHRVKSSDIMGLPDYTAYIVHTSKRYIRKRLVELRPDGSVVRHRKIF